MPSTRSQTRGSIATTRKILPKACPTPDESLEGHLTQLVLAMTAAINARDFDPSSPAWTPTTYDFTSEPAFHVNDFPCNLDDFLQLFDKQTRDHPDYFTRINGVDVHVNSKKDHATVFTDVETNGLPPGIVRPSVGVIEFVKVEGGMWKCRKYRCMPGMEFLGVEWKKIVVDEQFSNA